MTATKTLEEAWEMARTHEVYGALLDTNYVTHMQDDLHRKGVLVDQRFHNSEMRIRLWVRKSDSSNNHNNNRSCSGAFKSYFSDIDEKLQYLKPKMKVNVLQLEPIM